YAAPRVAPVPCDADGRFAVPLPPGRYELRARGAGVPSGTRFGALWLLARVVHDLGEIVVPDGATLRGRVVDEAQHPVAGARVFVGSVRFDEALGDYVARDADAPPRTAITGAQGTFAFPDLAPGTASVVALHADSAVATAARELPAGGCGD